MTTKDQERKALAQIRKIVEGLGEDSYVATAFEGCFEIAEENIDNDWACSMKQNWEAALKEQGKLREICADIQEENKQLKEENKHLNKRLESANDLAMGWQDKCHEAEKKIVENWNAFKEQEEKAEALEQEIIKLKAKLYDLMTA